MLTGTIKSNDGKDTIMVVKSTNRKGLRGMAEIMAENDIPFEVTEEREPRVLKFRNINVIPATSAASPPPAPSATPKKK